MIDIPMKPQDKEKNIMYLSDMKKEGYPEELIEEIGKSTLDSEALFQENTTALREYVSDYLNERGYKDFMANELPALLTMLIIILGENMQVYPCYPEWYAGWQMDVLVNSEARNKIDAMFTIMGTIDVEAKKLGPSISDIDACIDKLLNLDESKILILDTKQATIVKKICDAAIFYAAYGDYTFQPESMRRYFVRGKWETTVKARKYYPRPSEDDQSEILTK